MKLLSLLALTALSVASALPAGAQTLLHRYSMNGSANDSVGTANGTVVGGVTFTKSPGVNGVANFAGGNSASAPCFISLPLDTVSGLQNATVEIFVSRFSGGQPVIGGMNGWYQALFDVSNKYDRAVNLRNYIVLTANRDPANLSGDGLGLGSRLYDEPEVIVSSGSPLPTSGGVVTLVYQGFSRIGSIGTVTLYLNGNLVARTATTFSFGYVTAAKESAGGSRVNLVGIGGGSPFADATFNGDITEVRIWSGAMTPAQVQADFTAGPGTLPSAAPAP